MKTFRWILFRSPSSSSNKQYFYMELVQVNKKKNKTKQNSCLGFQPWEDLWLIIPNFPMNIKKKLIIMIIQTKKANIILPNWKNSNTTTPHHLYHLKWTLDSLIRQRKHSSVLFMEFSRLDNIPRPRYTGWKFVRLFSFVLLAKPNEPREIEFGKSVILR